VLENEAIELLTGERQAKIVLSFAESEIGLQFLVGLIGCEGSGQQKGSFGHYAR
jgi:hypothetical protein